MSLLVVSGPPGAGKSTIAARLADELERSVLVDGDSFFGYLRRGAIQPWLPESHEQNGMVCRAAAAATGSFAAALDTVYDGVLGPWFLPTFLDASGLISLDYVVLLPTVEHCVQRVQQRLDHSFVDEPATRHMHEQFVRAEIDARHVIVNDGDVETTLDDIRGRRERNELLVSVLDRS
jgi:cytidylate kinase